MAVSRPLLRKEREGESRTPHYTTTQHSFPPSRSPRSIFHFPPGDGEGEREGKESKCFNWHRGRTNERTGWGRSGIDRRSLKHNNLWKWNQTHTTLSSVVSTHKR